MPLDTSIILQGQAPQIANPLDLYTKALTMKHLTQQSQIQDQDLADNQSLRNAFRNNLTTGPDGKPVLDKQAVLSDLMQTNPKQAIDYQKMFQGQDLEKLANDTKISKELAWSVSDPNTYATAVQKMQQMGVANSDKLPAQYDPQFVQNWQMHTLEGEKQIDVHMKQQEFERKDRENDLKHDDNEIKRDQLGSDKHEKYVQHIEDTAKGWRSDPASTRADAMIGAAASGKAMIDPYRGREDEMPIQDIHALVSDRLKAITGATPTEKEIEAQMPHTLYTMFGGAKSMVSGKPEPANAGEFVKRIDDGFREMEKTARGVLVNRQNTVTSSPRLSDDERKRISAIGVPEPVYKDAVAGGVGKPATVIQGGHTYNLNTQTGEYE